jgi:CDGSH-type Zn-finger protein
MSEVVVKSTENGPNLVIVDGKVIQAWCQCGGSTLMPFCDGSHKKNGFTAQSARSQGPLEQGGRGIWNVRAPGRAEPSDQEHRNRYAPLRYDPLDSTNDRA